MVPKTTDAYCEPCAKVNQRDYGLMVNHMREHPGATVMEIILATGVTLKSINCFVEDGSISYVPDPARVDKQIVSLPEEVKLKQSRFHTRDRR